MFYLAVPVGAPVCIRLITLVGCLACASAAAANQVSVTVKNSTPHTLRLESSHPPGKFLNSIGPYQSRTLKLNFEANRSAIAAIYTREGSGAACKFSASNDIRQGNPTFTKSAVSVGRRAAGCVALQRPQRQSPYNYKVTFDFKY